MRWCSFAVGSRELFGFAQDDFVVSYAEAAAALGDEAPPQTLLAFIEEGSRAWERSVAIARAVAQNEVTVPRYELGAVTWRAPIRRPSKILGVPINNASIARWAYRDFAQPGFFLKPPSALTGHRQPVRVLKEYGLTHPEPELAAIIKQRARNVREADALQYVFGYTIINDITSPDLKEQDSIELNVPRLPNPKITWRRLHGADDRSILLTYHTRSKGCDTFAPMGPYVTTPDEIGDPNRLGIRGWLGNELVTQDSTANLRFSVQQVIATASRYMTLEPGDVVHFGMAAVPALPDKYPTSWDLDISRLSGPLAVEIEGLGRLENPVVVS